MFILTKQPESYFKGKIDCFFISSLKMRDDFLEEHGHKKLMFEGILMNQEIQKTLRNKLRYTRSKKKYVIYQITEFEEDIVENIANFFRKDYDGKFLTTNKDLKKCADNIKSHFDHTIF